MALSAEEQDIRREEGSLFTEFKSEIDIEKEKERKKALQYNKRHGANYEIEGMQW